MTSFISDTTTSTASVTFDAGDFRFIGDDSTFKNSWGTKSGRKERGGVRSGRGKISVLSHAYCRQQNLTAAGKDHQWFSLKFSGARTVYLRADDTVFLSGYMMTVADFYRSQRLIARLGL